MAKTILITGSSDGIGLATAKTLSELGHHVLLHGRSQAKLTQVENELTGIGDCESYLADLSVISEVEGLANAVMQKHNKLDVLINNAGVFNTPEPVTSDGLDVRFVVNTIAPYLLTQRLLPLIGTSGRVVNLSSAAQSPVKLDALIGQDSQLGSNEAYAQSKLAITMWSRNMALAMKSEGPAIIAINPGSLLATNMVKKAYGISGSDISVGADILVRAALDDEFADASGKYYDNDNGDFASPHPDALDAIKCEQLVSLIETLLAKLESR